MQLGEAKAVGRRWRVTGGADKGGIVVRVAKEIGSEVLPEKLATTSVVEEIQYGDPRLQYSLISGSGPQEGWVTVKTAKMLLELVLDEAPPPGSKWWVVVDAGGALVRVGHKLMSKELPDRLEAGAVVEELQFIPGNWRLHYRLIKGKGPKEGWISVQTSEKVNLRPLFRTEGPAAAPALRPQDPLAAGSPSSSPSTQGSAASSGPPTVNGYRRPAPPLHKEAKAESPGPAAGPAMGPGEMDFATLVADLRERYQGCVDLELPSDAWKWSAKELENYFESGGFIKPKAIPVAPPRTPPPPTSSSQASSSTAPPLRRTSDGSQLSEREALDLLTTLHKCFKAADFQFKITSLGKMWPERKQRNHPHAHGYLEAFERLVLTVYCKVLPKYNFEDGWSGVNEMHDALEDSLANSKVRRMQEEVNVLLGLPRNAVLRSSKKEEFFQYRPGRDGNVPGPALHLVEDEDSDEANEFLVVDDETGELRSYLEAVDCKWKVPPGPHVSVRGEPSDKAPQLGRRNPGETFRVCKVVDGEWLQLNQKDTMARHGVAEAWVHVGGPGRGPVLERLP